MEVTQRAAAYQTRIEDLDNLDKLCIPRIRSKLTWVIRRNENMMAITNMFKEIHADF